LRPPRTHAHGGDDKHAGHSVAMFRDRFWLSLVLSESKPVARESGDDV
jgi:hypothetical protein